MTSLRDDLERLWNRLKKNEKRRHSGEDENLFWALRDVSFEVEEGDVLGVIGKNGAGKSTLLKVLSRITEPTYGAALMRGRVASLLEVGTGFHPDLTGRENVFLNGAILGMRRAETRRKFDEIIEFSGIGKFIDTPVKRYSSGMYVRLAFAVAAHLEPEILIVDEVLAVGDAEFQKKCLGKMKDVASGGRTVLFVSHNMSAVTNLCKRAIWLKNGTLMDNGPSAQVVSRYLSDGEAARESVILDERVERKGSGLARFRAARLLDREGTSVKWCHVGDSLVIEFDLEVQPNAGQLSVAVELSTKDGQKLANMVDRDSCYSFDPSKGTRQRIRVEMGDLRLYPDSYVIGFFVGTLNGAVCYDHVPVALGFEICEGGALAKRTLPTYAGRFFFTPEWTAVPWDGSLESTSAVEEPLRG